MSQAQDSPNAGAVVKNIIVGAIAGGIAVVVLLIAITTYLIWRFVLTPRRQLETDRYDLDEGITKAYGFMGGGYNLADRKEHVRFIAQPRPESEIPNSSIRSKEPSVTASFFTAPTSVSEDRRTAEGSSKGGSVHTAPSYLSKDSAGNLRYVKRGRATVDTRYHARLRSAGLVVSECEEEMNWSGRGMHVEFGKEEAVPLSDATDIVTNAKVQVQAVTCGRIRVCRKTQVCHRRFTPAEALEEVRHLQALKHSHIVRLVGSYYQDIFLSILTYPVADVDLSQFMKDMPRSAENIGMPVQQLREVMQSFFPCLCAATAFIHLSQIKHMDIKPANILISIGSRNSSIHLFMTDFGISRIIRDPEQSQTNGPTGRTEMYCSPEVADGEPRGRASDIFGLGCVFAEILTCIAGQTVQEFRNRRTDDGVSFHSNLSLVVKWIEELDFGEGPSISPAGCQSSILCRKTTLDMINQDPNERPTASQLLEKFPPRPCCKQGPVPLEPILPRVPEEEPDIIPPLPPIPAILPTPHTSSRKRPHP